MAIKGKKKSRGGGARRRPAQAPRPQSQIVSRTPWYRTSGGRVAAAIGLAVGLAAVAALVTTLVGNANERDRRRTATEDFVDEVRLLQQEVAPAGTGMMLAPATAEEPAFQALRDEADEWVEVFEGAQTSSVEIAPPDGLGGALEIFRQSLALYAGAARTFDLATRLDGKEADRALALGTEQRDRASAIWSTGIALLDAELIDLGLDPSGIGLPAEAPEGLVPGDGEVVVPETGSESEPGAGEEPQDGSGEGTDEGAGGGGNN
jgi:hypothetical protein